MKFNKSFLLFSVLIIGIASFFYVLKKNVVVFNNPKNQSEKEVNKIKVAMGYIPNVQFAPFYVSLEKGFFNQEGLEIEFNYNWETDIIALLAKGELDFGIGSGEQIIIAQSQGLPITNIFNWYQRFPVCIVSLSEKNIIKPDDLIDKTVGSPAVYGASFIGYQALLRTNNINEKSINLEVIGYTQIESLIEKKVDAAICYRMNEPVKLKNLGYQINIINIADYINFVSNGLITNKNLIEQKPELVSIFTKAFSKGLQYTIDYPEEAFIISQKYIPEIKDKNTQKEILDKSIEFWKSSKLGLNNPEQWQKSVELLLKLNFIEKAPEINSLFTNQFLN